MAADPADKARRRLQAFRGIADERLQRLNLAWVQLEQGQDGGQEAGALFGREMHTLKGEAGLMGFSHASSLLHKLEDLVGRGVKAGSRPAPEVGDLVLRGLDLVATLIGRDPKDPAPDVEAFLAGIASLPDTIEAGGSAKPDTGHSGSKPTTEAAATPVAPLAPSTEAAARSSSAPTDSPAPAPGASDPARRIAGGVRLTVEKLDKLRDLVAEMLLTQVRVERSAVELRRAKDLAQSLHSRDAALPARARQEITQLAQSLAGIEPLLRDEGHQIRRLVGELDSATRELRMVPISSLLDRYPVVVRTVGRRLGKDVQMRTEGDATAVDREVLERLDEPLLHIVQNAVDHGIESGDERVRNGKSRQALIKLRCSLDGKTLHVEVEDDGGGIDVSVVRSRAIELKILDSERAGHLDDTAIIRTLFSAGMSTRTTVTETSGRGVGLNVVLSAVEGLGGRVDIRTRLGAGTTFHLQVPVTTAISAVMLCRVGGARYAIPAVAVDTILDASEASIAEGLDGLALRYGENLIPLLALEPLLGEAPTASDGKGGRIVVVRSGLDRVALSGSEDHLSREVVLKPVGRFFGRQQLLSAAVHMEDGSLALVLKPAELVLAGRERGSAGAGPPAQTSRAASSKTVVVADDSPVVRDLIAEALRAHGLRVIEASDGEEALKLVVENASVDLVVTDVEMPRLDGIGLIRALRARDTGRRIPIVVVSMRGSDDDKRAAMTAGADAYLVKTDLSHAGLWALIARFLG